MKNAASLEMLEARIAPAILLNPTTLTYTDSDGDLVTVKATKGTFQLSDADGGELGDDFTFIPKGMGQELTSLNLHGDQAFSKTNITITAKRTALGGDGSVNIGAINASGIDLGAVKIAGDLSKIVAGDNTIETTGLASLEVRSLGLVDPGVSEIKGRLGTLKIAGDMHGTLNVIGGMKASLGTATIGASLVGGFDKGALSVEGDLGTIKIGGDLRGGGLLFSTGKIEAHKIGTVKIGGSIVGGNAMRSGSLVAISMGSVFIGGDVRGGNGEDSGYILSQNTGNVRILGSLVGGGDFESGAVFLGPTKSLTIGGSVIGSGGYHSAYVDVNNARVRVGGDLIGGSGVQSGNISAPGFSSIVVGGSLIGSDDANGLYGGSLNVSGPAKGTIKIGGSLHGGAGSYSGAIFGPCDVKSVIIAGSLDAGDNSSSGGVRLRSLGALSIGGDVHGSSSSPVLITVEDNLGSLKIAGTATHARVLAGYNVFGSAKFGGGGVNADASIGGVTVGGDWLASSIAAGVQEKVDGFGDCEKIDQAGAKDLAEIVSRIGSILVKGQVRGTSADMDSFGFGAELIGSIKVGGNTIVPLKAGGNNDLVGIALGTTGDFFIREVSA